MSDVTRILSQIESGDPSAAEQLLPLVYEELRKLAAAKLADEKPGQTLQATALVHEAYLRLVAPSPILKPTQTSNDPAGNPTRSSAWNSRGHFFGAAAEAMRRILVDNARKKLAEKRGGSPQRVKLVDAIAPESLSPLALLALDEALERLRSEYPQHASLVNLRFFAALTLEESAASLGISVATAKRHWVFAQAWLYGRLADEVEDAKKP